VQELGSLRVEFGEAAEYDFLMRADEAGAVIQHVPKVLSHWRDFRPDGDGGSIELARVDTLRAKTWNYPALSGS
jgi:hypothetical protein